MQIVVSYEEASKNGDMSALTCFKPKNNNEFEMVICAVSNEADEIFKIVSKQGYLKEHDSELLNKLSEKLKAEMFETYPKNTNGVKTPTPFTHFAYTQMCKIVDKVIEEIKVER